MSTSLGAVAAVATALTWAFSSIVFTFATLRAGAMAVNRVRLLMAVGWLVLAHGLFRVPLPLDADGRRWLLLGASASSGWCWATAACFRPSSGSARACPC